MHPCNFPCGPTALGDNCQIAVDKQISSCSFDLYNVQFKSQTDNDRKKYRITLRHKATGEVRYYDDMNGLTFMPDLKKLKVVETDNIIGKNKTDLLLTYGTKKDQRMLKEQETYLLNPEAQKAVRAATNSVMRDEKIDSLKGNKLNTSYMDHDGNNAFDVSAAIESVDDIKKIRLSLIAPDEILSALAEDSLTLSSKKSNELDQLVQDKVLYRSVLPVLKIQAATNQKRIQLCVLLNHMITFAMLPIRRIRSKIVIENCPPIVLKFLFNCYTKQVFSDGNKATINVPKEEKEKLLIMILALYSYLTGYSFEMTLLQADLKASTDKLKKYLQIFNVKVTKPAKNGTDGTEAKDFVASTKTPFVIDS